MVSFTDIKNEVAEILGVSDISPAQFQHETKWTRILKEYGKLETEKKHTECYFIFLLGYHRPSFPDFESYLRTEVGLDEDNIQLTLKHYKSFFIFCGSSKVFTEFKIVQRPFIPWQIMKGLCKLNMMILAWNQKLFLIILVGHCGW